MGKYGNVNWCNVRKVLKKCSVGGCYVKIVRNYDTVCTYYFNRKIGSNIIVGTSDRVERIELSLDLQITIWQCSQLWDDITSISIYKGNKKYGR